MHCVHVRDQELSDFLFAFRLFILCPFISLCWLIWKFCSVYLIFFLLLISSTKFCVWICDIETQFRFEHTFICNVCMHVCMCECMIYFMVTGSVVFVAAAKLLYEWWICVRVRVCQCLFVYAWLCVCVCVRVSVCNRVFRLFLVYFISLLWCGWSWLLLLLNFNYGYVRFDQSGKSFVMWSYSTHIVNGIHFVNIEIGSFHRRHKIINHIRCNNNKKQQP